jgi:ArsR family transcriptional regulator
MSTRPRERFLSDRELAGVALHFRMLGEPTRLKILQAVCRRPRAVGDIVAAAGASQANVSKHLSLLAAAGILTRRKDGQSVYYGMKDALTLKLCRLVHNHWARSGSKSVKPPP